MKNKSIMEEDQYYQYDVIKNDPKNFLYREKSHLPFKKQIQLKTEFNINKVQTPAHI